MAVAWSVVGDYGNGFSASSGETSETLAATPRTRSSDGQNGAHATSPVSGDNDRAKTKQRAEEFGFFDKGDKRGGGSDAYNNNHTRANHNNDINHHHHGGVGGSVSSETSHESKKGGLSSGSDAIPVVWPPKFVIALTNKEKEDDFMAIKGSKLP
nr:filaggrin-2-like isoform X2 [Ipomoea trifida]